MYAQTYNSTIHQILKSIKYKAALAITGAIRMTSKEKLCNELSLETLEKKVWTENYVTF